MKLLDAFQQRLSWRLFVSYLIIVLVGVIVLTGTAELHAPTALARHVAQMQALLGQDTGLVADLDANFHAAVNEVLTVAALAAIVAAVFTSTFVSRRIVGPIQQMMQASRRIAAGDYHERVLVPGRDELAALAHSFNQMAETLERTEQRRMELIGNVAHELRTPLSGIRGVMEGLLDGVLPAEAATYVQVQNEVGRLQRLVRDLEELSRAEAGQIPLELRAVNLGELIRAAANRLESQFQDKAVSLQVDVASNLPMVRADAGRITQVLLNLLGNALQYTPSDGQVSVRAWHEGRHVFVAIQDTGIGISAENLPYVFERFYRVDKSRSRVGGGSGIGLTIARHLVEAHGGRIWAQSPGPNQGSTFTFTLPCAV